MLALGIMEGQNLDLPCVYPIIILNIISANIFIPLAR